MDPVFDTTVNNIFAETTPWWGESKNLLSGPLIPDITYLGNFLTYFYFCLVFYPSWSLFEFFFNFYNTVGIWILNQGTLYTGESYGTVCAVVKVLKNRILIWWKKLYSDKFIKPTVGWQLRIRYHGFPVHLYKDLAMVFTNENWFVILLSGVYFGDLVTEIFYFSPQNSKKRTTQNTFEYRTCSLFRSWLYL